MRIAGQESEAAWRELLQSLVARQLGTPALAVIDGNPGLQAALRAQWPELAIQRCTTHKLRNLLAKDPAHLREEMAEDYRRLVYGETREAVEHARASFLRKWRLRCKAVVSSFEEAGDELFTSCSSLSHSGRRCAPPTRSSASTRSSAAALRPGLTAGGGCRVLLYGLLRSGQIVLRRIDGRQEMPNPKRN
jgi:transposase-like protein